MDIFYASEKLQELRDDLEKIEHMMSAVQMDAMGGRWPG